MGIESRSDTGQEPSREPGLAEDGEGLSRRETGQKTTPELVGAI